MTGAARDHLIDAVAAAQQPLGLDDDEEIPGTIVVLSHLSIAEDVRRIADSFGDITKMLPALGVQATKISEQLGQLLAQLFEQPRVIYVSGDALDHPPVEPSDVDPCTDSPCGGRP